MGILRKDERPRVLGGQDHPRLLRAKKKAQVPESDDLLLHYDWIKEDGTMPVLQRKLRSNKRDN